MDRPGTDDLSSLREEIDRIDDGLVDLLAARLQVVRRIADAKGKVLSPQLAIRPAREAIILRRLARRAEGMFPRDTLVRIWRELLAATTRVQTPLSILVAEDPDLRDLARDHFGSMAPVRSVRDSEEALRRVASGDAHLAVLGLADGDLWWMHCRSGAGSPLQVVARLPFGAAPGRVPGPIALVVGALTLEPSGDDLTLVRIEATTEGAVDRLLALWQPPVLARSAGHGGAGLVELAGWPEEARSRLEDAGLYGCEASVLGAYARPLAAADLT